MIIILIIILLLLLLIIVFTGQFLFRCFSLLVLFIFFKHTRLYSLCYFILTGQISSSDEWAWRQVFTQATFSEVPLRCHESRVATRLLCYIVVHSATSVFHLLQSATSLPPAQLVASKPFRFVRSARALRVLVHLDKSWKGPKGL